MQFQQPPNATDPLRYLRGIGYGFLAGLVVGVLIGWFFHGVVSLLVRFGLLLILLVPLILIVLFLWRSRQSHGDGDGGGNRTAGGMRVYTWSSAGQRGPRNAGAGRLSGTPDFRRADDEPEPDANTPERQQEVIDLEFEELKREIDGKEQS